MNTQLYEKIVKVKTPKQTAKLVLTILSYVLYLTVWFFIGLLNSKSIIFIFALGILTALMIILIRDRHYWRY